VISWGDKIDVPYLTGEVEPATSHKGSHIPKNRAIEVHVSQLQVCVTFVLVTTTFKISKFVHNL